MGHAYFQDNEVCISGLPTRLNAVIFSCETTEYSMRKASLEVHGESLLPVFNSEKKPVFEPHLTYLCEGVIQALSHLYFLEYGFLSFNAWFVDLSAESRQNIRIQACIHT